MALKETTKILQSKKARTQYLTIPSSLVSDSQYPFKGGEEVEIVIDPKKELMMIQSKESEVKISGDKLSIKTKKK